MSNDKSDYSVTLEAANSNAFAKRIKLLIKEFNGIAHLARTCGVSDSVVRKWANGRSDPSRINIVKLALNTAVTFEWLLIGSGPMHISDIHQQKEDSADYQVKSRDSYLRALKIIEEVLQAKCMNVKPDKKVELVKLVSQMLEQEDMDMVKPKLLQLVALAS